MAFFFGGGGNPFGHGESDDDDYGEEGHQHYCKIMSLTLD